MKKALFAFLIVVFCVVFTMWNHKSPEITVEPVSEYVGRMCYLADDSPFSIRLLILKHCTESMADGDAKLAIQAASMAKSRGLRIRDIGNHTVDKNGLIRQAADNIVWSKTVYFSIDEFKRFVKEQAAIGAEAGDTLVIFTIGHGSRSGYLDTLGQRPEVMKALAEVCGELQQETLWWQLSCYAASTLPPISSLTPQQQDLFSIVASSPANQESPAYVEGKYMEKVFNAMAENSPKIDPNRDEMVEAGELAQFMDNEVERGRGSLVFAKSNNEIIFGLNFAQRIPILDRNNPQQEYPRDYIPMPKDI